MRHDCPGRAGKGADAPAAAARSGKTRDRRAVGAVHAAALAGTISALTQASPAAGPGMYGSMLLYQDAGGYVLVGVASFTAAVVITALCMKYRNREKKRDTEEEEK